MLLFGWVVLVMCWLGWAYPFVFRAPHNQQRPSITAMGATRAGLFLESLALVLAFAIRLPEGSPPHWLRIGGAIVCGLLGIYLGWGAIRHLGRQFRVNAGLYDDHELVTSGPYSVVRHPIYSSMLAMLVCSLLVLTPWKWAALCLVLFVAGTEIRVRAEDRLLASRFGERFHDYRKRVPAYLPFVR